MGVWNRREERVLIFLICMVVYENMDDKCTAFFIFYFFLQVIGCIKNLKHRLIVAQTLFYFSKDVCFIFYITYCRICKLTHKFITLKRIFLRGEIYLFRCTIHAIGVIE